MNPRSNHFRVLRRITASLLMIGALLLHVSPVSAYDAATKALLFPYYGENSVCGETTGGGVATAGKDNEETLFRFFLSKGLTPNQVAGMMGNFRQESGFNPKAHQRDKNGNPMATGPYPVNTVGFGVAQWTFTSRQQPLVNLAAKLSAKKGTSILPNTMEVQKEYIWIELTGNYYKERALDPLKAVKSAPKVDAVRKATIVFHDGFEGSSDDAAGIDRRVGYSKESLALMIGRGVVTKGQEDKVLAGTSADDTGTSGTCGEGGAVVVDGYAWPRAPKNKSAYSKSLLPICKNPVMNGNYTRNGRYTDEYGNTESIKTCHHDATPAFDLMAEGGEAVYAITDGYIVKRSNFYGGVSNCWSIQFKSTNKAGGYYYWYGHLQDANQNLPVGITTTPIAAGTKIASIAKQDKGSSCWLGGIHLHIDSGCVDKQGKPRTAGNDGCRRPGFLQELGKVYEALPS